MDEDGWMGVADLGWVDMEICAQILLQNSRRPRQNWADSGTLTIKVYQTQVRNQMGHPVLLGHP